MQMSVADMESGTPYEVMRDRMRLRFLEYDQTHMIEKLCLKHDGEFSKNLKIMWGDCK